MRRTTLAVSTALLIVSADVAHAQRRPDLLNDQCVLRLPGMDKVAVRTGLPFKTAGDRRLEFDLYLPPESSAKGAATAPLVLFANGVGDPEIPLKSWGIYKSWARLAAVSGMAAVLHDSRAGEAAQDVADLVTHLRSHAADLRFDSDNIALWACSANVGVVMPYAMDPKNAFLKAVVLYYGALDPRLIRGDLPLFIGRAGLDVPRFNASIDAYVAKAVGANASITVVNLPGGHHAFDAFDDNDASRAVVRQTLAFMKDHLSRGVQAGLRAHDRERRAREQIAARDWPGAIETTETWVRTQPDDPAAHQARAEALYNLKRYREAGEAYARAGDLGAMPAVTWYNAACSYALAGEKERALDFLTSAFATGRITDREQVRADPDLASLKDDARFTALLSQERSPAR